MGKTRVLRDIECRGCAGVFRSHLNNRVYCSDLCGLLTRLARGTALCAVCSTKDRDLAFSVFLSPEAKAAVEREFAAFADEHEACRRRAIDERDCRLECQCVDCREGRGESRRVEAAFPAKPAKRSSGYQKHRNTILERDDWVCQICELPIARDAGPFDDKYGTLDHIEQVQWGGGDEIANLRAAHRWCNGAREGNPVWSDDMSILVAARQRFGAE